VIVSTAQDRKSKPAAAAPTHRPSDKDSQAGDLSSWAVHLRGTHAENASATQGGDKCSASSVTRFMH
jgi:hypothetical protein